MSHASTFCSPLPCLVFPINPLGEALLLNAGAEAEAEAAVNSNERRLVLVKQSCGVLFPSVCLSGNTARSEHSLARKIPALRNLENPQLHPCFMYACQGNSGATTLVQCACNAKRTKAKSSLGRFLNCSLVTRKPPPLGPGRLFGSPDFHSCAQSLVAALIISNLPSLMPSPCCNPAC